MIRLIRISDGLELLLNVDLIKAVEKGPPPIIVLTTGEKMAVKGTDRDIMQKISAYKQGSYQGRGDRKGERKDKEERKDERKKTFKSSK